MTITDRPALLEVNMTTAIYAFLTSITSVIFGGFAGVLVFVSVAFLGLKLMQNVFVTCLIVSGVVFFLAGFMC
jgi:type IV secretory pathway VirB2 component (pilin)